MEAHHDQAARGREAPIASYAETQAAVRPPRARAGDLPASWPILLILALQAAVSVARLRNTAFQDEALYLGPMLVLAVLVKYAGILFVLPVFAVLACVFQNSYGKGHFYLWRLAPVRDMAASPA
jgi:hypothetical protein